MREPAAFLWLPFAAALLMAQSGADTSRGGPQLATFHSEVDDSAQPYALYVPRNFDAGRKYPLVISLHTEESNHRLNLRQVLGMASRVGERDTEDMRYFPAVPDVDFIVACPLARGSMGYQGIAERDVYDMLADVEQRFPIDRDRVYLTGASMGGAGVLWLALTRPDVWAAVAPVCPAALPGMEGLAGNALNLPVRLFQGELDPLVPPESSRAWQKSFLDAGVAADYLEYPAVRHNVWEQAYRNGAVFRWFANFKRDPNPERVRFATASYRYSSAYWVRIDGLTPGVAASIDASRTAGGGLKIETAKLDGFTITREAAGNALVNVMVDGTALRVKPARALSFTRASGQWRAGLYVPTGKHAGAEGPISEAASARHIYVYGTRAANAAEQEERRRVAEEAARWSTPRARLGLTFAVKADRAVTEADLDAANLVLFGTSETNELIARFAPSFPLALNPGAADYGLLFIAPLGKRYALVSSGLPWWTGAEDAGRGGPPQAPPQYRLLATFGDYILFRGSLSHVVAEGRFDRNWKVPADASEKMRATGTVTIR